MMEKQVPLNPPIQSPSQIRPRLVELHHKVMAPDLWHCIFAQPFVVATIILVFLTVLQCFDEETLILVYNSMIERLFSVDLDRYRTTVHFIFWFTAFAHFLIALHIRSHRNCLDILLHFPWCSIARSIAHDVPSSTTCRSPHPFRSGHVQKSSSILSDKSSYKCQF